MDNHKYHRFLRNQKNKPDKNNPRLKNDLVDWRARGNWNDIPRYTNGSVREQVPRRTERDATIAIVLTRRRLGRHCACADIIHASTRNQHTWNVRVNVLEGGEFGWPEGVLTRERTVSSARPRFPSMDLRDARGGCLPCDPSRGVIDERGKGGREGERERE